MKDPDLQKTQLTGDKTEKQNATCDFLTLPKIIVSSIRSHSANLIGLSSDLFTIIILYTKDWTSLIRSVSRVTTVLANDSSVFQLFSFLMVCSDMISTGSGFVAFFACVNASSVCIHLSCLVCLQSLVHGV